MLLRNSISAAILAAVMTSSTSAFKCFIHVPDGCSKTLTVNGSNNFGRTWWNPVRMGPVAKNQEQCKVWSNQFQTYCQKPVWYCFASYGSWRDEQAAAAKAKAAAAAYAAKHRTYVMNNKGCCRGTSATKYFDRRNKTKKQC